MPVRFCIVSQGTAAGDASIQSFRTGFFSITVWPRNVMGFTSSSGATVMRAGTKPWPENRNTSSSCSPITCGRKNPVSAFVRASVFLFSRSYRKMFDAPVKYELP